MNTQAVVSQRGNIPGLILSVTLNNGEPDLNIDANKQISKQWTPYNSSPFLSLMAFFKKWNNNFKVWFQCLRQTWKLGLGNCIKSKINKGSAKGILYNFFHNVLYLLVGLKILCLGIAIVNYPHLQNYRMNEMSLIKTNRDTVFFSNNWI